MRHFFVQVSVVTFLLAFPEVAGWTLAPRRPYRLYSASSSLTTTPALPGGKRTASFLRLASPPSKTRLHLAATGYASPVVRFVALHILGGLLGAPIVSTATQKPAGVDPLDNGRDGWYTRIDLPSWTPPNKLFGPVWTLLYASMGWSLYLVLQHPKVTASRRQKLLLLWGIHFVSNLIWAPVFFGLKRLRLGLVINYWLITSLGLWMALVGHFQPLSALLLVPYLGWLVFATVLNRYIVRRNPTVNGYNEAMFQSDLLQLRKRAALYADGKL